MATKKHLKKREFEKDTYSDYDYDCDYDLDDDFGDIGELAKDFHSTDWEDPYSTNREISARRKIERRNDFKTLYSQFDDWNDDISWDKEW